MVIIMPRKRERIFMFKYYCLHMSPYPFQRGIIAHDKQEATKQMKEFVANHRHIITCYQLC